MCICEQKVLRLTACRKMECSEMKVRNEPRRHNGHGGYCIEETSAASL